MAQTREQKIYKLVEELKEELLEQPMLFNERFNGKVSFEFDIRDGGVFGDVSVIKRGSKKKA